MPCLVDPHARSYPFDAHPALPWPNSTRRRVLSVILSQHNREQETIIYKRPPIRHIMKPRSAYQRLLHYRSLPNKGREHPDGAVRQNAYHTEGRQLCVLEWEKRLTKLISRANRSEAAWTAQVPRASYAGGSEGHLTFRTCSGNH